MYIAVAVVTALALGAITSVVGGQMRKRKLNHTHSAKPRNEQTPVGALGAYRLFWHSGGSSVAAVGMLDDGTRWYAPANWTNREPGAVVSTDWSLVKHADLIER